MKQRAEDRGQRTEGNEMGQINGFRELNVYKNAFALSMRIFVISKEWPKEERYSLTDQIRRSSRSVGANLAESWGKRRYGAHFVSKLTDADGENQETIHWIEVACACGYISTEEASSLVSECDKIGGQLGSMLNNPEPFLLKGR